MPTLEHRVAKLSSNALARRQARALRLLHTLSTVEPGLIGLELKRERALLIRRLQAAAEEGRDGVLVAIQGALTRNRDQMLRLAGVPMPGRAREKAMRAAHSTLEDIDVSELVILEPQDPPPESVGSS